MSDLIDRQAATEKLDFYMQSTRSDLECELREDEMDFYKACHLAKKIITNMPSVQPEDWMERNKERILQAGMEGREIEFRIGGRLFAIREKAQ